MSENNPINETENLYYYHTEEKIALEMGGSFKYIDRTKLRRAYHLTKADEQLLNAETAEQTKKALEMGANPNAEKEYGARQDSFFRYRKFAEGFETPLMRARNAEQTKLLLEAGADPNLGEIGDDPAENESGSTPLMGARTAEQTKFLIEAGANVNARDKKGCSVLMHASTPEQTKLLLEAGAKPDERCLLSCKNAEKFILLLDAGADKSFQTPLQENEIINLLKKYSVVALNDDRFNSDERILDKVAETLQARARIAKNKERLKNGPKLKGKSGVVIADEIAKRQISGEEKRVITPKVGKELRQEIMKEMNSKKKGQRE